MANWAMCKMRRGSRDQSRRLFVRALLIRRCNRLHGSVAAPRALLRAGQRRGEAALRRLELSTAIAPSVRCGCRPRGIAVGGHAVHATAFGMIACEREEAPLRRRIATLAPDSNRAPNEHRHRPVR